MTEKGAISRFLEKNFKHFNAAALLDAAIAYDKHIRDGKKMLMSIAGAMSTAELGHLLAQMIRQDKIHFISCTGNNIEEDVMNLVAHNSYKRVTDYRDLTPQQEWELAKQGYNRVTDTCIPEEAFREIQHHIVQLWGAASRQNKRYFPHEYVYELLLSGALRHSYQIDPADSWVLAAAEKNLPIVVPGWEDSTLGNIFAAYCMQKRLNPQCMKSGIEYMEYLSLWYREYFGGKAFGAGFFQIGGGIAGDFPICSVPMMRQDLGWTDIPFWSYFCQISDSTTSYGSYSGAVPNEKITWGKLETTSPKFIIESDATIVAPLLFAYILHL